MYNELSEPRYVGKVNGVDAWEVYPNVPPKLETSYRAREKNRKAAKAARKARKGK